jgi:TonB-linked SusC/RagA family outer membrane protein
VEERNLTSAVSRIDARELEEVQATSIDQAIQGRLAGVDIVANSGDPGAGMSIRIRGTSSINQSSDPLIVVDGMPYDIAVPEDFNFSTADEQGYAQLLSIAPSDIKDITVLKDAASTAMWGSRASNGVLVINTKRGAKGKPTLNYTFKGVGMKQPDAIPMLNGDQYSMLIPEAYMNRLGVPLNTQSVKEFQYDPSDPYYYHNYSQNTDWIEQITQIGYQQDHNISLQGGGDKATYFGSLGYNNTTGTTVGTDLSRINARINLNYTVSDRIRFRTDLSYTHSTNHANYLRTKDDPSIRSIAYIKMPNMSVYEYDELGNQSPNYFSPLTNVQGSYPGTYNPLAMAREGKSLATSDRVRPTFNLNYDLIKGKLLTTFDVAFDINNNKTNRFLPQTATGLPIADDDVNRADDNDTDIFNVDTKTNLIYTPTLGDKHSLQVVGSFQTNDYRSVYYGATTANTASSYFQDPSIPSRIQDASLGIGSGTGQSRRIGLLVNAQYSLLDRYILNVGLRRDGNSKFSENYRYGNFPALGARWRVSGERFMEKFSNFLTDLSLRYSYGASGNPPKGSYAHFAQYGNFGWNYLGLSGLYPLDMELKNLKWETVIQSNFGANLSLFDGRLELDAEVYKKKTKDMFYPGLQISSVSGFDNVDMNVGIMDNDGWELTLNTTPYKTKDLTVRFDFNVARNINVIREISEFYPRERGNINANGQYKIFMQENNPFGSFYGFRYKGVYPDAEASGKRCGRQGHPGPQRQPDPDALQLSHHRLPVPAWRCHV